jgi:tRNA threonylcarbamoyladenosine biosynthesis protein TsaE
MPSAVIITENAGATGAVGEAMGRLACPGDVFLLSGDLGAGKTQLVKGIARGLGVTEPVTSPTFNILLVHEGRLVLYHIDLYRLESASQLEDIDYFGTLEAGGVAAVEWGDRFCEAAPDEHLLLTLHMISDDERRIELSQKGSRAESLADALLAACGGLPDVRLGSESLR